MANTPAPAVPTLHSRSTPLLTTLGDQMAYIIRFFFANPGSTSSNNEGEMVSFRKLNSLYGKQPNQLCDKISSALTQACRHYTDDVIVSCSYEMKDKVDADGVLQGTYGIEIAVTTLEGQPIIPHGLVTISGEDNNEIDLKFKDR